MKDYFLIMNKIVCAEQFSTRVIIFDADQEDWNKSEAMLWDFDPFYHREIKNDELRSFGAVSDAKPVMNMTHLLITASGGAVCLIRLEDKKVIFYGFAGGNTHSAELLPDGNIVSASSSGNYLRLFDRKNGTESDFELKDAHGAVWDRKRDVLWSSSLYGITRWEYNGRELKRGETYNPFGGEEKFHGHDLYPVYGEDKLFMTGKNVAVFNPETCIFERLVPVNGIKCITKNRQGELLVTQPNEAWWTDIVSLFGGEDGQLTPYRSRKNMRFYKARWVMPNPFSEPDADET